MVRSRHKGDILRGILICCGCDEPILCRVLAADCVGMVWDPVESDARMRPGGTEWSAADLG